MAEDPTDEDKADPKDNGGRPKAPSRKNVIVNVQDGFLTVQFRQPEGHASMEVKDLSTGFSLSFEFDSAAGFRHSLPSPASNMLTVRTEKGNSYVINL